jgi:hypothetical protein
VKRWKIAALAGMILVSAWGYRMSAARGNVDGAPSVAPSVALDSLHSMGKSRPSSSNNYSSVAVIVHHKMTTYSGTTIDHGILFDLVPGHGGTSSEADITFSLGKKYDRLSGMVFASGASNPAPLSVTIQGRGNRTSAQHGLFSGQASPGGPLAFTAIVRGLSTLTVSASTSFDCVCAGAMTVLVVGQLTGPAGRRGR